MTTNIIKHVCDRCGNSVEFNGLNQYPNDWQGVRLSQTGADLDLCNDCNKELEKFLSEKGASDMKLACFKDEEVL